MLPMQFEGTTAAETHQCVTTADAWVIDTAVSHKVTINSWEMPPGILWRLTVVKNMLSICFVSLSFLL